MKREAQQTAASGMDFATSLSETSQLGMEMHVFNVQPQATERIVDLIDHNEATARRLSFLRGLVPAVYTGMAYLALVGGARRRRSHRLREPHFRRRRDADHAAIAQLRPGACNRRSPRSMQPCRSSAHSTTNSLATESARVIDHGQPIGSIGALRLDDVSFEYTTDTPVLRNVSATIDPHEIIGVIGPSGSGKSTLVQLLLGLREPTSGLVLADGRDIRVLSRTEWARKVTFVPQDAHLIAGTIADNIRFLRDDVSQERHRASGPPGQPPRRRRCVRRGLRPPGRRTRAAT